MVTYVLSALWTKPEWIFPVRRMDKLPPTIEALVQYAQWNDSQAVVWVMNMLLLSSSSGYFIWTKWASKKLAGMWYYPVHKYELSDHGSCLVQWASGSWRIGGASCPTEAEWSRKVCIQAPPRYVNKPPPFICHSFAYSDCKGFKQHLSHDSYERQESFVQKTEVSPNEVKKNAWQEKAR